MNKWLLQGAIALCLLATPAAAETREWTSAARQTIAKIILNSIAISLNNPAADRTARTSSSPGVRCVASGTAD